MEKPSKYMALLGKLQRERSSASPTFPSLGLLLIPQQKLAGFSPPTLLSSLSALPTLLHAAPLSPWQHPDPMAAPRPHSSAQCWADSARSSGTRFQRISHPKQQPLHSLAQQKRESKQKKRGGKKSTSSALPSSGDSSHPPPPPTWLCCLCAPHPVMLCSPLCRSFLLCFPPGSFFFLLFFLQIRIQKAKRVGSTQEDCLQL